ncbi:hypothetical protein GCM10017687_54400 [Streptomyces echinatus]|uniref:Uncharacterized protein n=1 Tax=Streptomyces echinatus TaxID=67293 RepID=A0A7W9Q528_9ACTN|nr:hypothetical protein [Streptomyces echinatus]
MGDPAGGERGTRAYEWNVHLSLPIEPKLARSVTTLPPPGARPLLYGQKAGFRVLVFTGREMYLQSGVEPAVARPFRRSSGQRPRSA